LCIADSDLEPRVSSEVLEQHLRRLKNLGDVGRVLQRGLERRRSHARMHQVAEVEVHRCTHHYTCYELWNLEGVGFW